MPAVMTMLTVTEEGFLKLLAWLSPAYPVGAFSYSHGLEWAVEAGLVRDGASLLAWLEDVLRQGSGWADAVLFARAHDAVSVDDRAAWAALGELAAALPPTAELELETMAQGAAFTRTTLATWPDEAGRLRGWIGSDPAPAYPLAVAAVCAAHGVGLGAALPAYLHALLANFVSAGVRLVPLGQTDGQRVTAGLCGIIRHVAEGAAAASLDELGTSSLVIDWCSMQHETQYTRLFRS
jgi:urease accessory protein